MRRPLPFGLCSRPGALTTPGTTTVTIRMQRLFASSTNRTVCQTAVSLLLLALLLLPLVQGEVGQEPRDDGVLSLLHDQNGGEGDTELPLPTGIASVTGHGRAPSPFHFDTIAAVCLSGVLASARAPPLV